MCKRFTLTGIFLEYLKGIYGKHENNHYFTYFIIR